jgi:hypothetical protein
MIFPGKTYSRSFTPLSNAERKRTFLAKRERSFSLLFLLLTLFLVMRVTVFVRQRSGSEFASIDTLAILQIGVVGCTFLLILDAPRLKQSWFWFAKSAGVALFLYYVVAVGSGLWSSFPLYSIYRSLEFLCQFYAIYLAIFYSVHFYAAEKKVILTALVVILLGVAKHLKLSGFTISIGALHTNSYSASAAMLFCYCLGEYLTAEKRRKRLLRIMAIVGLFFLSIGTSSASNVAALAGVAVVALFSKNKTLLVLALCGGIVAFFLLSLDDITRILFPGKTDQAIMTMTGRASIWDMYINMIEIKPLLGYGFAASTRMAERYMTNTHNGYLAVVLGTGLFGASVFLIACWRIVQENVINWKKKLIGSTGCFAALTAGLVNNLALSLVGEQWTPATMTFALFLALHIYLNTTRLANYKVRRRESLESR